MIWTKELREELLGLKAEFDSIKKWQFWKIFRLLSIINRLEIIEEKAK